LAIMHLLTSAWRVPAPTCVREVIQEFCPFDAEVFHGQAARGSVYALLLLRNQGSPSAEIFGVSGSPQVRMPHELIRHMDSVLG
jgi:hypothetical protein